MDKRDCKRMLLAFLVLCVLAIAETWGSEVIDKSGIKGGLIVHIGCGDGRLTNGLRAGDGFLVHGLDTDAGVVQKARQRIRDAGVYGKVSIDSFDGRSLPYIDNVVNLIVAGSLGDVSRAEVMRVLVPGGVAMVGGAGRWSKLVKPASAGTDEWTHYLHDPSNNAVSHDEAVSIPYHLQWAGLPKWTRNHNHLNSYSAVVSSGGRIFSIVDEAVTHSVRYPSRWRLVARDAYNGVVLWKKPIGPWEGHLRKFRSGPSELPRRLVAVGDRVYVTPGYGKVAMALDAASGDVVRIYKGTEGTHEIIYSDGVLYLVAGEFDSKAYEEALDIASFSPPIEEKRIIAIDAASGRELWAKDDLDTRQMLPTTLCVNDGKVYFNGLDSLVCLDRRTGKVAWKVPRPVEHDRLAWSAPTLVVYKGVVLSAEGKHGSDEAKTRASRRGGSAGADVGSAGSGDSSITWTVTPSPGSAEGGELIAFGASDGRELWRCDAAFGYSSPPDLFVADGLVWVSAVPGMNETDVTEGRDPVTGKVKRRIDTAEVYETAHHHRCYRDRATDNFLLLGRTGVEFVDLTGEDFQRHYWIRGSCQYGVMPANGLLYLPGHSCGCYIQSKLNGFLALAPKRGSGKVAVNETNRLEKGPAYNKISNIKYKISNRDDWPMLRYDPARSGYTKVAVPADLKLRWRARLGGKLTSPVISGDRLVVARSDSHSVVGVDTRNGRTVWEYTTGGRIDSPPALYMGMAIFGSYDGYVYCIGLSDGRLVWRFRAAPADRRTVVFGQVESLWPVIGSVLVYNGQVYCTAGRTSYLDGGITLFRLDPKTGRELGRNQFYSRDPKTGKQPDAMLEDVELPGVLPDILTVEKGNIFLRDVMLNADGTEQKGTYMPHLYSSAGLLDGTWWHRTYWIWGERAFGRASGWAIAGRYRPSGRILSHDGPVVYGYDFKEANGTHTLFCADKKVEKVDKRLNNNNEAVVKYMTPDKVVKHWSQDIDVCGRAMVKAADVLFVAGPRSADEIYFDDEAAPSMLAAFDTKSGRSLSQIKIASQPVFDGMAAANGRIYISLINGEIVSYGNNLNVVYFDER